MCLLTKERKMRTATEDIICYKVLLYHEPTGKYLSPYNQNFEWDVDKKGAISAKGRVNIAKAGNLFGYFVNGGAFHTYKEYNAPARLLFLSDARNKDAKNEFKLALATCVIPKGTKYYHGRTSTGLTPFLLEDGYASKKLKIQTVSFVEKAK